ncbi:MAG: hypothetical protein CMK03_14130 [Ponticaulis sp.]|nr:hypothetical protein [Ponticaulis sp.]
MSKSITIRNCAFNEEAVVIAGYLQANGIPAVVADFNMAHNDWMMNMALGGRVSIPEGYEDEARALLSEAYMQPAETETENEEAASVTRRDRWKVWPLLVAGGFVLSLPLMVGVWVAERFRRGQKTSA